MISQADALRLLIQACPQIRAELIKDVEDWLHEDGSLSAWMIFASASHYVADQLFRGQVDAIAHVFEVVEKSLVEGTEDVKNAAATCFLENLANREIDVRLYAPMLGKESLAYCRAWGAFTGRGTSDAREGADGG